MTTVESPSRNTPDRQPKPTAGKPKTAKGGKAGKGKGTAGEDRLRAQLARMDWSWRHGPVIGPVNAGLGAAGLAMVGDLAGVSPWWAAAAGGAAAAAVVTQAASRRISVGGLVFRGACWVAAGGWATWAMSTSPWSGDTLAALAAGTLVAGLAAPELAEHEQRVVAAHLQARTRAVQAGAAAARVAIAQEWEARLDRVCQVRGALVEAVQAWPDQLGYSLQVRLPKGGTTWRTVAAAADGLATDADLPAGCAVEVAPGPTRAVVILRVATADTTAGDLPYPDDTSPLSFTEPLPIGMHRAGRVAVVELLDDPMLLVGRRGSGKTNTLQVINADLVRCTDVLVWHIDLNGAGMSRPWLTPWLRGRAARPVVDWVASTVAEALLMLDTAVAIAKRRKTAYASLMDSIDDDKIPVSADVPGIVIVLDEGAEAVASNRGHRQLAAALEELISIGRAARVQALASSLRATAEILPPAIKAQAGTRLFMRPDDEHEMSQLLGWRTGVSLSDVAEPGTGLLRVPSTAAVQPMRSWRITPAQIQAIATAVTGRRPWLDHASAQAAADVYADRWTRYQAWYRQQGGHMPQIPDQPDNPSDEHAGSGPDSADAAGGGGVAGLGPAYEDLQASLDRLREVRKAAETNRSDSGGKDGQDYDARFAEIVSDWDEAQPGLDGPSRMLAILREAGPEGLHWQQLLTALTGEGIACSRPTLYRWLSDAGAALTQPAKGVWAINPNETPDTGGERD